eukprot:jgi/Botrbrau1/17929/Bobra.50_1s0030.1
MSWSNPSVRPPGISNSACPQPSNASSNDGPLSTSQLTFAGGPDSQATRQAAGILHPLGPSYWCPSRQGPRANPVSLMDLLGEGLDPEEKSKKIPSGARDQRLQTPKAPEQQPRLTLFNSKASAVSAALKDSSSEAQGDAGRRQETLPSVPALLAKPVQSITSGTAKLFNLRESTDGQAKADGIVDCSIEASVTAAHPGLPGSLASTSAAVVLQRGDDECANAADNSGGTHAETANAADAMEGVTAGLDPADVIDGVTAGPDTADAMEGVTAGLDPADAMEGVTAGPDTADAMEGVTAGLDPADVIDGVTAGLDPADAMEGVTAGLDPANAMEGVTAGLDPADAMEGVTAGPDTADSPRDRNSGDPANATGSVQGFCAPGEVAAILGCSANAAGRLGGVPRGQEILESSNGGPSTSADVEKGSHAAVAPPPSLVDSMSAVPALAAADREGTWETPGDATREERASGGKTGHPEGPFELRQPGQPVDRWESWRIEEVLEGRGGPGVGPSDTVLVPQPSGQAASLDESKEAAGPCDSQRVVQAPDPADADAPPSKQADREAPFPEALLEGQQACPTAEPQPSAEAEASPETTPCGSSVPAVPPVPPRSARIIPKLPVARKLCIPKLPIAAAPAFQFRQGVDLAGTLQWGHAPVCMSEDEEVLFVGKYVHPGVMPHGTAGPHAGTAHTYRGTLPLSRMRPPHSGNVAFLQNTRPSASGGRFPAGGGTQGIPRHAGVDTGGWHSQAGTPATCAQRGSNVLFMVADQGQNVSQACGPVPNGRIPTRGGHAGPSFPQAPAGEQMRWRREQAVGNHAYATHGQGASNSNNPSVWQRHEHGQGYDPRTRSAASQQSATGYRVKVVQGIPAIARSQALTKGLPVGWSWGIPFRRIAKHSRHPCSNPVGQSCQRPTSVAGAPQAARPRPEVPPRADDPMGWQYGGGRPSSMTDFPGAWRDAVRSGRLIPQVPGSTPAVPREDLAASVSRAYMFRQGQTTTGMAGGPTPPAWEDLQVPCPGQPPQGTHSGAPGQAPQQGHTVRTHTPVDRAGQTVAVGYSPDPCAMWSTSGAGGAAAAAAQPVPRAPREQATTSSLLATSRLQPGQAAPAVSAQQLSSGAGVGISGPPPPQCAPALHSRLAAWGAPAGESGETAPQYSLLGRGPAHMRAPRFAIREPAAPPAPFSSSPRAETQQAHPQVAPGSVSAPAAYPNQAGQGITYGDAHRRYYFDMASTSYPASPREHRQVPEAAQVTTGVGPVQQETGAQWGLRLTPASPSAGVSSPSARGVGVLGWPTDARSQDASLRTNVQLTSHGSGPAPLQGSPHGQASHRGSNPTPASDVMGILAVLNQQAASPRQEAGRVATPRAAALMPRDAAVPGFAHASSPCQQRVMDTGTLPAFAEPVGREGQGGVPTVLPVPQAGNASIVVQSLPKPVWIPGSRSRESSGASQARGGAAGTMVLQPPALAGLQNAPRGDGQGRVHSAPACLGSLPCGGDRVQGGGEFPQSGPMLHRTPSREAGDAAAPVSRVPAGAGPSCGSGGAMELPPGAALRQILNPTGVGLQLGGPGTGPSWPNGCRPSDHALQSTAGLWAELQHVISSLGEPSSGASLAEIVLFGQVTGSGLPGMPSAMGAPTQGPSPGTQLPPGSTFELSSILGNHAWNAASDVQHLGGGDAIQQPSSTGQIGGPGKSPPPHQASEANAASMGGAASDVWGTADAGLENNSGAASCGAVTSLALPLLQGRRSPSELKKAPLVVRIRLPRLREEPQQPTANPPVVEPVPGLASASGLMLPQAASSSPFPNPEQGFTTPPGDHMGPPPAYMDTAEAGSGPSGGDEGSLGWVPAASDGGLGADTQADADTQANGDAEDDDLWVQCDSCNKWRLLDRLPERYSSDQDDPDAAPLTKRHWTCEEAAGQFNTPRSCEEPCDWCQGLLTCVCDQDAHVPGFQMDGRKLPAGFTLTERIRKNSGKPWIEFHAVCKCGTVGKFDRREKLAAFLLKHRRHMPDWADLTPDALNWSMSAGPSPRPRNVSRSGSRTKPENREASPAQRHLVQVTVLEKAIMEILEERPWLMLDVVALLRAPMENGATPLAGGVSTATSEEWPSSQKHPGWSPLPERSGLPDAGTFSAVPGLVLELTSMSPEASSPKLANDQLSQDGPSHSVEGIESLEMHSGDARSLVTNSERLGASSSQAAEIPDSFPPLPSPQMAHKRMRASQSLSSEPGCESPSPKRQKLTALLDDLRRTVAVNQRSALCAAPVHTADVSKVSAPRPTDQGRDTSMDLPPQVVLDGGGVETFRINSSSQRPGAHGSDMDVDMWGPLTAGVLEGVDQTAGNTCGHRTPVGSNDAVLAAEGDSPGMATQGIYLNANVLEPNTVAARDPADMVADAERDAADMEADAERNTADMEADAERDAADMEADAERDAADMDTDAERDALDMEADAERDAADMQADAERDAADMEADAERDAADMEADADLEADAQMDAADMEADAERDAADMDADAERDGAGMDADAERDAVDMEAHAACHRAAIAGAEDVWLSPNGVHLGGSAQKHALGAQSSVDAPRREASPARDLAMTLAEDHVVDGVGTDQLMSKAASPEPSPLENAGASAGGTSSPREASPEPTARGDREPEPEGRVVHTPRQSPREGGPSPRFLSMVAMVTFMKAAISAVLGCQALEALPGFEYRGFLRLCGLVFIFENQRLVTWSCLPPGQRRSRVVACGHPRQQLLLFPSGQDGSVTHNA